MGLFDAFKRNNSQTTAIIGRADRVADTIEFTVKTLKAAPYDYSSKVIERFRSRRKEIIGHMKEQNWTPQRQRELGEEGFNSTARALQFPSNLIEGIEEALQGECLAYLWLESLAGGSKRAEAAHAILEEIAGR